MVSIPIRRPPRRELALILSLALGIPIVIVGLLVLLFIAVFTPRHFAVLSYNGVSCHDSVDHRFVYVDLAVTEHDDFPALESVQLQGANGASITAFGWLKPPLGFGSGLRLPSAADLSKAFAGSAHPRSLPARRSELVLKIRVQDPGQPSVFGVQLLIDNGEPAYYQTLVFNLHESQGHCSVSKGVPGGNGDSQGDA